MNRHKEIAAAINRAAVDDGKLIETGFDALRALAIAKDAPQVQVDEMRLANGHDQRASVASPLDLLVMF